MKRKEIEMLFNLKEQGFMPEIDIMFNYSKKNKSKLGSLKPLVDIGNALYFSQMVKFYYLPLAKLIILNEELNI